MMTFEQFKEKAKETGYKFNSFFKTKFFKTTKPELTVDGDVFFAEITSHEHHISLCYPNNFGGVTLTKGFGKDKVIQFFDSIEEIHA